MRLNVIVSVMVRLNDVFGESEGDGKGKSENESNVN